MSSPAASTVAPQEKTMSFLEVVNAISQDIALTIASSALKDIAIYSKVSIEQPAPTIVTPLPLRLAGLVDLPQGIPSKYFFDDADCFRIVSVLQNRPKDDSYSFKNFLVVKHVIPEDRVSSPREVCFPLPATTSQAKFWQSESEERDFFQYVLQRFIPVVRSALDVLMILQYCPIRQQLVLRDTEMSVDWMDQLYSGMETEVKKLRPRMKAAASASSAATKTAPPQQEAETAELVKKAFEGAEAEAEVEEDEN